MSSVPSREPVRHEPLVRKRLWALGRAHEYAVWWSVFGLILLAGAGFLYYETRGTTFWVDEWQWALTRRGGSLGTFLDPHNGHLSLVPVAIYKLLFATAGLRHYQPYRVAVILAQLGCTTLLFIYARRRVGGFLAVVVAAVLMFFGPGWQDILWPFQIAWLISLGAGVGALLMLDRGDRVGAAVACALTALSLASSGIGVAIAAGILVDVVFGPHGWRRWWVMGAPLAAYVLWSIGYQDTSIAKHGIVVAPDFAFNAGASSLAAVLGFGGGVIPGMPSTDSNLLGWGQPLAVAALLLALWRLSRPGRSPRRALALLTAAGCFWLLTGLTRWYISAPYESRYLYVGALFVLLLMVEVAGGPRVGWIAQAVVGAVALVAVITNIGDMRAGANFLRGQADMTRAKLGALDIARPIVSPGYQTGPFGVIRAGPYFATERAIGSPASTPAEIARLAEPAREAADADLAAIHDLRLAPVRAPAGMGSPPTLDAVTGGSARTRGACTSFVPAPFTAASAVAAMSVTVAPAGLLLRTGQATATVNYRRFGASFQSLGSVAPSSRVKLRIAPDLASQPWHLQVSSSAPFSVCHLAP